MATIQEAYRGVLERGEEWRRRSFATGWTIVVHNGVPYNMRDGQLMDEYKPAAESVFADDWERVQPPTPRPIYLMLPCEKGKGTHRKDQNGEFCCCSRSDRHDYRQVAFPLTVEDMEAIDSIFTYAAPPNIHKFTERRNRVRETLKLMKEAQ